jgi:hypothetical protein
MRCAVIAGDPEGGESGKWRLLLPGASEPRLTLLRRQGFNSVFRTAYAARATGA